MTGSAAQAADNDAPIQRPSRAPAPAPSPTPTPAPAGLLAKADLAEPARAKADLAETARAPAPRPRAGAIEPSDPALRTTAGEPEAATSLEHAGFIFDGRIGTAGCLRSLCTQGHGTTPGLRLDGFVGGNIRGWVDLGLAGGWGSFGTSVEANSNLLRLYGVEPAQLQAAATAMGTPLGFNPFALQVHSARMRTARVGPSFRVHLIPRGRGIAYLGAGVGYSTFLADYGTSVGNVSLRFHGIDVPLQAGAGVQITEHLAAVVQFDYTFTRYPLARFEHPQRNMTLPVAFLDTAANASGNASIKDGLPQTWGIGLGLRARI